LNHKRWNQLPALPKGHPLAASGLKPLVAQLLYNRGISEPTQVEPFLKSTEVCHPTHSSCLTWKLQFESLSRAAGRGEGSIYGDFDADGITSTAVLMHGLRSLGIETTFYIPHRINEGHGLK